jgi:hypothetical protein
MVIFVLAFHGMEDKSGILIYLMVDDFEQVAGAVKANPQVFVLVALPFCGTIVAIIPEGVQNLISIEVMLERGLVKFNNNLPIHIPKYTSFGSIGQAFALWTAMTFVACIASRLPKQPKLQHTKHRRQRMDTTQEFAIFPSPEFSAFQGV